MITLHVVFYLSESQLSNKQVLGKKEDRRYFWRRCFGKLDRMVFYNLYYLNEGMLGRRL